MFLTPDEILNRAVPTVPDPEFRQWTADVVSNFEREIDVMFPGLEPEEQADYLRELRNLVHGLRTRNVGAQPLRLQAVRRSNAANLQLVKDVATFWWSSMLFSPKTHGVHGQTPAPAIDQA